MSYSTRNLLNQHLKAQTLRQVENPLPTLILLPMPQLPIIIITPGKELSVPCTGLSWLFSLLVSLSNWLRLGIIAAVDETPLIARCVLVEIFSTVL